MIKYLGFLIGLLCMAPTAVFAQCSLNDAPDNCPCGQEDNDGQCGGTDLCCFCSVSDCGGPDPEPPVSHGYCVGDRPGVGGGSCEPGKYMVMGTCLDCPAGYYCPDSRNAFCCNVATGGDATTVGLFPESAEKSTSKNDCFHMKSCGAIADCRLYFNGEAWCVRPYLSHSQHLEKIADGIQCVSNNIECSNFSLSDTISITNWGSGDYEASGQTGNATWDSSSYTWNVSNCKLTKDNVNITATSTNCEKGTVWRAGSSLSGNAATGFSINYTGSDKYFCTGCAQETDVDLDGTSLDGCSHYNNEEFGCMCKPDGSTEYCDSIGCFKLGPNSSVCN